MSPEVSLPRERGIIFGDEMVRAIHAERKTQTRRTVRSPHIEDLDIFAFDPERGEWEGGVYGDGGAIAHGEWVRCPYGKPGDLLYVKEAWSYRRGNGITVIYRADGEPVDANGDVLPTEACAPRWGNARFMPKKYARIWLEVTDVRVQRLQAISEEDARAEGCVTRTYRDGRGIESPRDHFHLLWDSINGKRATWLSNPWVWALTFRRLR